MAPNIRDPQAHKPNVVNLTEDDLIKLTGEFVDLTIEERVEAAIDLTTDIDDLLAETPPPRGDVSPVPEGYASIPMYILDGYTYVPGAGIELVDGHLGDCFRIVHIIQQQHTRKVLFRGYKLSSSVQPQRVRSFLPRNHKDYSMSNEYCLMAPTIEDLESGDLAQCLTNLDPKDVFGPREIIFTNAPFPAYSHFEEPDNHYASRREARMNGRIVVRIKIATAWNKSHGSLVRGRIERMRAEECDTAYRVMDRKLRQDFRAHNLDGIAERAKKRTYGDYTDSLIDLTEADTETISFPKPQSVRPMKQAFATRKTSQHRSTRRTLTFGDICTGAGGLFCGAVQSELKPLFAVDKCHIACKTSHMNFNKYKSRLLEEEAFKFLSRPDRLWQYVDILNMSWPCPYYSPSKTRAHHDPQVDANNEACIYATSDVLLKCKPRVATFEQTSGLVTHYQEVFERFINLITSTGYSVCWEVPDLVYYGATSHRRRLIAIASCPGEPLPTFPKPTHGVLGPGTKPFHTIRDALRITNSIPAPDGLDLRGGSRPRQEPSHNGRRLLQHTPTCCGITEAHPNGKRSFNLYEQSVLCGFPPEHRYFGTNTEIKRQQGNAVPTPFARTMYGHIATFMRESDRKLAAYQPEVVHLVDA